MTWTLDPAHSSVEFAVKHMMVAKTKGRFADFSVDAEIDEADVTASRGTVRINVASVDTRDTRRDDHLRGADFFDAAAYPEITFATRRIEPRGDNEYRLVGDLTIRGNTHEVSLDGEINGPVQDPMGNKRMGLSASGKLNRRKFGLTIAPTLETGGLIVGDEVRLSIEAELVDAA